MPKWVAWRIQERLVSSGCEQHVMLVGDGRISEIHPEFHGGGRHPWGVTDGALAQDHHAQAPAVRFHCRVRGRGFPFGGFGGWRRNDFEDRQVSFARCLVVP